ncbi:MAG TPA: protein translocase subunit SecF [Alphaproteobacteria bacterium]|jgi:preprotein translocase SecF subunit|nr:protein translocase subunit SecF [Alphaproteobacteria bacterium]HAM46165.1 protein translocase subunit SecF [Alphaproteobacteria bacterium]HBA42877.1 protein translocase subunit SecF [Alphaproteobacteria bacterium]HCO90213.1 protein translocase subunit SecF [Alphaproteobacteria bacterium]
MFRLRLVPETTNIKFVSFRKASFLLSSLFAICSVVLFAVIGLNYGIDFRGGTMIEIGTEGPADLTRIRTIASSLGLGDVQVQSFGEENDVLIRVEQQSGGEKAQQNVVATLRAALDREYGSPISYRRVEVVGPKISGELVEAGTLAVILAVIAMLVYIWFRFEWQFSVGAVVALLHDVVLTIGIFSLLQLEFNLSIIAAILTIVGYSMNDTVVVYDRVRENLRKYKKMPLDDLLNLSINDTLSRTAMTSLTTLLALLALYIFGGEVIRGFTFAMIWGVVVGTYSSIFVAAPLLLVLGVKRDWSGLQTGAADKKAG